MEDIKIDWFDDYVTDVPTGKKLYNFICCMLGRRKKKLKYKEIYLLIVGLNEKVIGEKEAKSKAMDSILKIYKYLNNKLPNGFEEQ